MSCNKRSTKNTGKIASFSAGLCLISGINVYAEVQGSPVTENFPVPVVSAMSPSASKNITPAATITVKGFRFTGNSLLSSAEFQQTLQPYLSHPCDLAILREAANAVTRIYRQHGHVLANAYILPQNITDGYVVITVVEGRIGKIIIEGNRFYSSDFIQGYLTSGTDPMTIERLEKGLLLLNTMFSDISVTGNFLPGAETGTTDIRVKVVERFPFQVTLTSNNYGSEYVSRNRFGTQLALTNAGLDGAQATVNYFTGSNSDNMHLLSGGYVLPLNTAGTVAGISAFTGNSVIGKDFADLGIKNEEHSGDIYLKHTLHLDRLSSFSGSIGFRVANTKYFYLVDQLSGYDKTRVLYAELQADKMSHGGKNFATLGVAQGLGNFLDGTANGDYLASRSDASNSFTKVNVGLGRTQPLSDIFSSLFRFSGQWSPSKLLAGEEWLIGGVNSVHGYASGEASGTQGYMASASIRSNPLENKDDLQLSLFLDYGYAYKKQPLIGSEKSSHLWGCGISAVSHLVDFVIPADVRFDIGWPLNTKDNALQENPVFSFDVAVHL